MSSATQGAAAVDGSEGNPETPQPAHEGRRASDDACESGRGQAASAPPTTPPSAPVTIALPESMNALLPSRGFLREYVEYAYPLTEAPAESHVAAALVTASALVGKKVTIEWAGDFLYLNIWANIVGPSTSARKTTALRKSESLVRAIDATRLLPDDTTGAALIDQLAQGEERVWYLSELGLLFAQCDAKFNVGLKQLIANLYDVPPELASARMRNKDKSQVLRVPRPYVAILGATTAAWLAAHLDEADLLGGLYARFLHFLIADPGEHGRRISIPPAVDQVRYERVLTQARRLSAYRGTLDLTAITVPYDDWYTKHRTELYRLDDRERLGPFWGRLETYCLKLAALHQLSLEAARGDEASVPTGDVHFIIEPEALSRAIALVEFLKQTIIRLLGQELAPSKTAAAFQKVLKLVRQSAGGRITRRDLQRRSNFLADDFNKVMRSLLQDGRLKQEEIKTPNGQASTIVLLGHDDD
jgi:hypothetical protein